MGRPGAALWAILVSYTVAPALAWLLGHVLALARCAHRPDHLGQRLYAGVVRHLDATRRGNEATALLALLGSTLLSWLCTTFWLSVAAGAEVALDTQRMMLDLVITLVIPSCSDKDYGSLPRLTALVDRRQAL